jgi:hypothetical protein
MAKTPTFCAIVLASTAFLPSISAQSFVTVTTGGNAISLAQKTAVTTFIASNAESTDVFKNVAAGQAQSAVLSTVAGSLVHLPVIGLATTALAATKITKIFGSHQSDMKGFDITYLRDLSAPVSIASGIPSFTVPIQRLQTMGADGSGLLLLRLRQSSKDSARIVRSTHVSLKQNKSQINPVSTEVLGTEEDIVATSSATNADTIVMTANSALGPGEYALVVPLSAPSSSDPASTTLLAWDFRVVQ